MDGLLLQDATLWGVLQWELVTMGTFSPLRDHSPLVCMLEQNQRIPHSVLAQLSTREWKMFHSDQVLGEI